MKIKYNLYSVYLFFTILIITYSSCMAFENQRAKSTLEALGYGMLLFGILVSFFKWRKKYRIEAIRFASILLPLLSVGIAVQELSILRKITVIVIMVTIIIIIVFSENYLRGPRAFKTMSYGCFFGVVLSSITCIFLNLSLIGGVEESVMGWDIYFNGGIQYKNVATMMIAIIISLYLYKKEKGYISKTDECVIFISFIVLIASLSRGAWIHFLVFFLMTQYRKIRNIKKSQRKAFSLIVFLVCVFVGIYIYENLIMLSGTYMFRYRGLVNYLTMFSVDKFYMIFGSAEIFYDKELDYVQTFRSITGWDGSMEIAWLNIFIKTGLLGVIGFVLIFIRYFKFVFNTDDYKQRTYLLAMIVMMLGTSMVATYIEEVHSLFGIYVYLLMSYYVGRIRNNNRYYNGNKRYLNE